MSQCVLWWPDESAICLQEGEKRAQQKKEQPPKKEKKEREEEEEEEEDDTPRAPKFTDPYADLPKR